VASECDLHDASAEIWNDGDRYPGIGYLLRFPAIERYGLDATPLGRFGSAEYADKQGSRDRDYS
jgi:hypothetical protein